MKSAIQSVEVSFIVHATEDQAKVEGAVAGLFPSAGDVAREALEGHYGNPIVRVRQRFTGVAANHAFEALAARLGPAERENIRKGIGEMMDEHSSLYIRLDKQALASGRVALGDADAVHAKVKPRLFGGGARPAEIFLKAMGGEG